MSQHSPEPWTAGEDEKGWILSGDDTVLHDPHITTENRDRILACVNACQTLPTEYLDWVAKTGRHLKMDSMPMVGDGIAKYEEMVGQELTHKIAESMQTFMSRLPPTIKEKP